MFAFFGFILVNLMFLNYIVLKGKQSSGSIQIVGSVNDRVINENVCDTKTCVPKLYDAIYQATVSQKLQAGASPSAVEF